MALVNVLAGFIFIIIGIWFRPSIFANLSSDGDISTTLCTVVYCIKAGLLLLGLYLLVKRKTFNLGFFLISTIITFVLCFFILEWFTYWQFKQAPVSPTIAILKQEKFPWIYELHPEIKAETYLYVPPASKYSYHDYFYFGIRPYSSKHITFNESFIGRNVPASFNNNYDHELWLFGGSTIENIETIDTFTIANQLAMQLYKKELKLKVRNYGTRGFQSGMELAKFQEILRHTKPQHLPSTAVFYDGFNDAQYGYYTKAGGIQLDISGKMKALVEQKNGKMLLYHFSKLMCNYSAFWKKYVNRKIETALFYTQPQQAQGQNLNDCVEVYLNNKAMITAICLDKGIKPVFVLQPMIFTKTHYNAFEKGIVNSIDPKLLAFSKQYFYKIDSALKRDKTFINLTSCLNTSASTDFFDIGHTGPYTGITIAQALSDSLEKHNIFSTPKAKHE